MCALRNSLRSPSTRIDIPNLQDKIQQTRLLLQILKSGLSRTVAVWERFNGADGDVQYFSDLKDVNAKRALKSVRKSFSNLKFEMEQLDSLERALKGANEAVSRTTLPRIYLTIKIAHGQHGPSATSACDGVPGIKLGTQQT